jgi:hypothetical protein
MGRELRQHATAFEHSFDQCLCSREDFDIVSGRKYRCNHPSIDLCMGDAGDKAQFIKEILR